MTDLRQAAKAALDALDNAIDHLPKPYSTDCSNAATDLRAALAAQQPCQYCNDTGDVHGLDGEWLGTCTACKWGSAQKAAQPVAFDHDIGADRYQVVKGSFWWHVRIGDSTANVGKFHTKMAAEYMALKLLTAFRDGAFMQSRAAQPVAWGQLGMLNGKTYLRMNYDRTPYPPPADVVRNLNLVPLFAAAQPQQAADELGWLIEMQFGDGLLWWSGCFDDDGTYPPSRLIARMVNDVNKAVRFSRREDAQRVLDAMLAAQPCPLLARAKTLYSVHEHMWPEAAQPQQAEGDTP